MIKTLVAALVFTLSGFSAHALDLEGIKAALKSKPYELPTASNNDQIFDQYCVGNPNSPEIPQPRYTNSLVQTAAATLSATKNQADAKLYEKSKIEFNEAVKSFKEGITPLAKSTQPEVAAAAQKILTELSKPNLTEFNQVVTSNLGKIAGVYKATLVKVLPVLAERLALELKGMDVEVVKKYVASLNTALNTELTKADFKVLLGYLNSLTQLVEPKVKQVDLNALKTFATDVATQFGSATADGLVALKDDATYLANQIAKILATGVPPTPAQLNNVSYYTQYMKEDINYYLEEGGAVTPEITKVQTQLNVYIEQFNSQSLLVALKNAIRLINENKTTQEITTGYNQVADILREKKDLTAEEQALAKLILDSEESVSNRYLLERLALANEKIKPLTDANQINQALYSVLYSLSDLDEAKKLSASSSATLASLRAELEKIGSSQIVANVKDVNTKLAAGGDLISNQELLSEIVYLTETLNSIKPSLAADLQKLVEQYAEATGPLGQVSEVTYLLATKVNPSASGHFYFYGGVKKLYNLGNQVPNSAPQGTLAEAHAFLTQLCGEYRDRATMIQAKLKWVKNLLILPGQEQGAIDPQKHVWSQVTAKAYYPYLDVSSSLWAARRKAQPRYITVGTITNVDNPVSGTTVCETKYIFSEYVSKKKEFDNLDNFNKGYEEYKKLCPVEDLEDYYDFRGDSNFKHYSPESNGMIWQATSTARGCVSPTKAKSGQSVISDQDCRNYFTRPFFYRYNAARSGLSAWLFRDDKHANVFNSSGSMVAIYPHREPQLAPFSFSFDVTQATGDLFDYDAKWLSIPGAWNSADIGFNAFTGLGTPGVNQQLAYERIRDAVDRHTDWYSSGYNDRLGQPKNQAYSPFVASSYEMSESDNFTTCGITVECPPDGLKRWMFIFRIKKQNWFTPARILNNETLDFEKYWFDETSFGRSGLADGEKAWDRLGTAMEGELDSIMYLINVDDGSGEGWLEE